MKGIYARSTQVADVIKDIKLSLTAWKVLFLIDGKTDLEKFEHLLGISDEEMQEAMNELKDLGLIEPIEKSTIAVEESELMAQLEELEDKQEQEIEKVEDKVEESTKEVETEKEVNDIVDDLQKFLEVEEEEKVSEQEVTESNVELDNLVSQIEEQKEEKEESDVESHEGLEPDELGEVEEINEDELLADLEKDLQDFILEEEKNAEDVAEEAIEEELVAGESDEMLDELLNEEILEEKVEVDEEKNKETEKEIEEEAVEEKSIPEKKEVSMAGTKKIMVVDDSVVIRKMVEIALENEPIDVVSAPTGKEALSKLDEENIDLIILDLMLPDLNGLDILKAIKAASSNLPVIILTGKDSSKDLELAKEYGAEDFITKPFKDEDLVSKVKSLL